jgi:hypothetical protein
MVTDAGYKRAKPHLGLLKPTQKERAIFFLSSALETGETRGGMLMQNCFWHCAHKAHKSENAPSKISHHTPG